MRYPNPRMCAVWIRVQLSECVKFELSVSAVLMMALLALLL